LSDPRTERLEALRIQVTKAVRRLCPSWLADEREDLVQAAMIRIVKALPDEGTGPILASYVWKTAYRVTIDEIRLRSRRPATAPEADADAVIHGLSPSPEDAAAGRELGRGIRACLQTLADHRRAAVVLFLLGHSVPETAARLGWNAKKAENLVYRGLADLRSCLSAKGLRP